MSTCVPQELVEYYQCHSLKESFKQLDTTLKYPYKSRERVASRASSRSPGDAPAHPAPSRAPLPQFPRPGPTARRLPGGGLSVGHTDLGQQPLPSQVGVPWWSRGRWGTPALTPGAIAQRSAWERTGQAPLPSGPCLCPASWRLCCEGAGPRALGGAQPCSPGATWSLGRGGPGASGTQPGTTPDILLPPACGHLQSPGSGPGRAGQGRCGGPL